MPVPQKEIDAILHYATTRHPGSETGLQKILIKAEKERQVGVPEAEFTLWLVALCFEAGRVFQLHNPQLKPDNFQDYDRGGLAQVGG